MLETSTLSATTSTTTTGSVFAVTTWYKDKRAIVVLASNADANAIYESVRYTFRDKLYTDDIFTLRVKDRTLRPHTRGADMAWFWKCLAPPAAAHLIVHLWHSNGLVMSPAILHSAAKLTTWSPVSVNIDRLSSPGSATLQCRYIHVKCRRMDDEHKVCLFIPFIESVMDVICQAAPLFGLMVEGTEMSIYDTKLPPDLTIMDLALKEKDVLILDGTLRPELVHVNVVWNTCRPRSLGTNSGGDASLAPYQLRHQFRVPRATTSLSAIRHVVAKEFKLDESRIKLHDLARRCLYIPLGHRHENDDGYDGRTDRVAPVLENDDYLKTSPAYTQLVIKLAPVDCITVNVKFGPNTASIRSLHIHRDFTAAELIHMCCTKCLHLVKYYNKRTMDANRRYMSTAARSHADHSRMILKHDGHELKWDVPLVMQLVITPSTILHLLRVNLCVPPLSSSPSLSDKGEVRRALGGA